MSVWGVYPVRGRLADGTETEACDRRAKAYLHNGKPLAKLDVVRHVASLSAEHQGAAISFAIEGGWNGWDGTPSSAVRVPPRARPEGMTRGNPIKHYV